MRICILIIFFILSVVNAFGQYLGFNYDGYERTYLVHLPQGYTGQEELSLIIAMHGGFGSAENMQNQSGLSEKADEENFIVVYPEGVQGGLLNIRTWNAGWCCGYASSSDIDDVGFINALLDTLFEDYAIDTTRVYATGMSNGGFMSYKLACELSDRIAAIAPVAASMSVVGELPDRPVPIIHFHSYEDSNVPFEGGTGDGVSNHYNSPVDSVLNAWAEINSCLVINDTLVNNSEYTHIQWSDCECNADIQLYLTRDGGHSWPGGTQTIIGDSPSEYINANDLMWEFFKEHTLNCQTVTNLIQDFKDEGSYSIYPNPTTGFLNIEVPENSGELDIKVFNQTGTCILETRSSQFIDLSGFSNGIYYVRIQTRQKVATLRMSLIRE